MNLRGAINLKLTLQRRK